MGIAEDFPHAVAVRIGQEEAAGLAPDFAETLAAFADGRRVDERQQFVDVPRQNGIEQRLVHVLQVAEKGVALEVCADGAQCLHPTLDLLVERADVGRQQAMQSEEIALGLGERRAFVEHGFVDQGEAAKPLERR